MLFYGRDRALKCPEKFKKASREFKKHKIEYFYIKLKKILL
jgi:hypothetical protein